ncbi:MAG: Di-heme cytochrome, transrane [Gemmatimonadetes bacterium]|nr:Di-heme cytochrome, transrane [Gemmatimonadota bacterium]
MAKRHLAHRHHWVVRTTHWINALALTLMVGSGLRIFQAYPGFARKGEAFCCYPLEGHDPPRWLTFGGGLAGARNWHFAMMWVLAVNGFAYLAFIYMHGEWRDLVPRRGDLRDTVQMVKFYLHLRRDHPHQGKHNALQKGAYFTLPLLGVLAVLTGVAIWKPVQLAPLTGLFGGYVWARYWHFLVMLALVVMAAGHVFMVFAVDPASLRSIVTGSYDESRSPEARNARPFQRGGKTPPPALHPTASSAGSVDSGVSGDSTRSPDSVDSVDSADSRNSVDTRDSAGSIDSSNASDPTAEPIDRFRTPVAAPAMARPLTDRADAAAEPRPNPRAEDDR